MAKSLTQNAEKLAREMAKRSAKAAAALKKLNVRKFDPEKVAKACNEALTAGGAAAACLELLAAADPSSRVYAQLMPGVSADVSAAARAVHIAWHAVHDYTTS